MRLAPALAPLAACAVLALAACGSPTPCCGPPPVPADPITAPAETWTWVDFPDSACGNGQPTGLAVNLTDRSRDVVVYLAGGGACWDEATCFVLRTAVNLESGYGAPEFAVDWVQTAAAFSRADPASPFRAMSFVYLPYCTGDLHAGDNVKSYQPLGAAPRAVHHVGARNVTAFLRRLGVTFPGARRVFLAGSSAGGFGVQLHHHRFAAAFPEAEVHALADGAQLVPPADGRYATFLSSWNLALPPGCAACATDPGAVGPHLLASAPNRRFALLANLDDPTLRSYLGYLSGPDPRFEAVTRAALDVYRAPNARFFALAGQGHTMLWELGTKVGPPPGNVPLKDWLAAWVAGSAAWVSVGP